MDRGFTEDAPPGVGMLQVIDTGKCAKHGDPWTKVCMTCAVYEPQIQQDADLSACRKLLARCAEALRKDNDKISGALRLHDEFPQEWNVSANLRIEANRALIAEAGAAARGER